MRATGSIIRNFLAAKGAKACSFCFFFWHQTIDLLDEQEDGKSHNQEINDSIEE